MISAQSKKTTEQVVKYADMFSAMGTEARLRIMQLLLSAHPEGLVVGDIQEELEIPSSTLSHHLDKLKAEGLVNVRRESTFLTTPPTRRHSANFCNFCMQSVALETRQSNQNRSFSFANRTADARPGH